MKYTPDWLSGQLTLAGFLNSSIFNTLDCAFRLYFKPNEDEPERPYLGRDSQTAISFMKAMQGVWPQTMAGSGAASQ